MEGRKTEGHNLLFCSHVKLWQCCKDRLKVVQVMLRQTLEWNSTSWWKKNTNVKKELHSRLCYSICSWIFIKGGFLLRPMCTLPWKAGWHVSTLALECLKGQPLKRIWSVGGVSADTTMHVHTHTHRNTHTPSYTPTPQCSISRLHFPFTKL